MNLAIASQTKSFSANWSSGFSNVIKNTPYLVKITAIALAIIGCLVLVTKLIIKKFYKAAPLPDNAQADTEAFYGKLVKKIAEAKAASVAETNATLTTMVSLEKEMKKARDNWNAAKTKASAAPSDKKETIEKEVTEKMTVLFNLYKKSDENLLTNCDKAITATRTAEFDSAKDAKTALNILRKRKAEIQSSSNMLEGNVKEFEATLNSSTPTISTIEKAKTIYSKIKELAGKIKVNAQEANLLVEKAVTDNALKVDANIHSKTINRIYVNVNKELARCKERLGESTAKIN